MMLHAYETWLMHHETGEEKYKEIAMVSERKLGQCFEDFYGSYHDVGFMWLFTSVANYRVTRNPDSRKRLGPAGPLRQSYR